MKILYFDVETTGTSAYKNEITQISGIIEINGEEKERFNFRCQPTDWQNVDSKALEVTGIGLEQLRSYPHPREVMNELRALLTKYIPKYTKMGEKFYPAGHNVQFDLDFLNSFIKRHGNTDEKKWGATTYQNWRSLDSRVFANFLAVEGHLPLQDMKLSTLCDHYGIEIQAHDAMSDIEATKKLIEKMRSLITAKTL